MPPSELPRKPARRARVSRVKGKGPTKGRVAPGPVRIEGKLRVKETSSGSAATAPETALRPRTDQIPRRPVSSSEAGYLRFTVHVDEDGASSVVASHFVASTLLAPSTVHGPFVYEVLHDGARLHVDSIPDLGVFRSFANPEGPREQWRHHIYELSSYDFDVRVPVPALAGADPRNVSIALYRIKDPRPGMYVGTPPLHDQYQRELREITRVEGIPRSVLRNAVPRQRPTKKRRK